MSDLLRKALLRTAPLRNQARLHMKAAETLGGEKESTLSFGSAA
jgi:hypothetical protein